MERGRERGSRRAETYGGDGESDQYGGTCSVQQEQEPLLRATVLLIAIARAVSSLLRQEPRFPGALL